MKTLLGVVVGVVMSVGVLTGSAVAAGPVKCTDPYAVDPTPEQSAACSIANGASAQTHPPAIPTANSKAVAKAAFTGDYNTIWNYISPQYQSSISHSHWLSCQKKNPVAPPGVTVNSIAVATTGNIPVALPKFGTQKIFEVQLQVLFTRDGNQSAALVYAYWFHNTKGKWVAVWLPSVYSTYKSGGCDRVGPTRGLY